jgi:hypothetical protein
VWFVGILAFSMGILLFVIGVARKMNPLNGEADSIEIEKQ